MVVLNVTYHCKEGMRDAFLEAVMAEAIDLASRGEKGNVRYDYYRSVEREDDLLLLEQWEDDDSLALHRMQPHFLRLGELKEEFVKETEISQYHAD